MDKELADRVVALGVGAKCPNGRYVDRSVDGDFYSDAEFVRDWRVAGALMEKVGNIGLVGELFDQADLWYKPTEPRTIIEACVEALEPVVEGTSPNE